MVQKRNSEFIMGIKFNVGKNSTLRDYQSYIHYKLNVYNKISKVLHEICEGVLKKRKKEVIREMEQKRVNAYKWYKEIMENKVRCVYWEISLLNIEQGHGKKALGNNSNAKFNIEDRDQYHIRIEIEGKEGFADPLIWYYVINELIIKVEGILNMAIIYNITNNYKDSEEYIRDKCKDPEEDGEKDVNYKLERRKERFDRENIITISDTLTFKKERVKKIKEKEIVKQKIKENEIVKQKKTVEARIAEIRKEFLEENRKVMEKQVEEMRKIGMVFKKPTRNKDSEIYVLLKEYLHNEVAKGGILYKKIFVKIRYSEEMREEELLLLYNYIKDLERETRRQIIDIIKWMSRDRKNIENEMVTNLKKDYKFIDYYSQDVLKEEINYNIKIALDKEIEKGIKEDLRIEIRIMSKDSLIAAYLITEIRLRMEMLITGNNGINDKEVLEDPLTCEKVNIKEYTGGYIVYDLKKNKYRKDFLIEKLKEIILIEVDGDRKAVDG